MIDRAAMIAASRRLRAASSELPDSGAAEEASARMGYLWAWSARQGGVLDEQSLEAAIWSFFLENPAGLRPGPEHRWPRRPAGADE